MKVLLSISQFPILLNYLSLLLSKACLIFEQFISTSTFKPNGSLSSSDENHKRTKNYNIEK